MTKAPEDATHFAEFYGNTLFYKLSTDLYYNKAVDHPEECWQKRDSLQLWEKDKWASVGAGWSDRKVKNIVEFANNGGVIV